jgi:four helix bundle protein
VILSAASASLRALGDYRKVRVWQHAAELCRRVNPLVRAATSIRLNIAEGAGLYTDPMFARHIRIALGSANACQDALD